MTANASMKLKKVSAWFSIAVLLALAANGVLMLLIRQAHNSVVAAQEHRQNATALTNELRQETEQLARLVRSYAVTGEPRYLFYYYDIVAIQKGEKAAPADFNPATYWDAVIAGRLEHKLPADGARQSRAERMTRLGFSAAEFAGLKAVLGATAAMNRIEQIAFAATQGLYDPASAEFVSDGEPHRDFASELVHGADYNRFKGDLSAAVERLAQMVDQRTNAEMARAAARLERLILLALGTLGASIALVLFASQVIRRRVLIPIGLLSRAADRLAGGDYGTRVGTRGESVEELAGGAR
ncbi:MAG: hybrid sensor histidine kinase/response regulator, partial [Burkholderiaceae bacterium]|nr:hybrid sensor histidine kinase/response regulator [Burkholderiaceae bacterium]